jgi:polysaccharide export outer membrane protein
MFRVSDGDKITREIENIEANYSIQKNDLLQLEVYTNKGERIVDPNMAEVQTSENTGNETVSRTYLVNSDGLVKFPLIGDIKLDGLTIRDAEDLCTREYAKFYKEPYIILKYSNKRVIVLGAVGGKVIPLQNENMKLTEIIALAGGMDINGKATNIRILRDKEVIVADLSTIAGYQKFNIFVKPNDIIYVEPVRRPFIEALRDYGPVLGFISSVTTLVVLILSVN